MKKPADWCSVAASIAALGGRWKPLILYELSLSPVRFNELWRRIPDASHQVLANHLRQLEKDGVIIRTVRGTNPLHVEYSLSAFGEEALPALRLLDKWGKLFLERSKTSRVVVKTKSEESAAPPLTVND